MRKRKNKKIKIRLKAHSKVEGLGGKKMKRLRKNQTQTTVWCLLAGKGVGGSRRG